MCQYFEVHNIMCFNGINALHLQTFNSCNAFIPDRLMLVFMCKFPFLAARQCNVPATGQNQHVSYNSWAFGSTARYTCSAGYKMNTVSGDFTVTCLADETWSATPPLCEGTRIRVSKKNFRCVARQELVLSLHKVWIMESDCMVKCCALDLLHKYGLGLTLNTMQLV